VTQRAKPPPVTLVGLLRMREHCMFTWKELQLGGPRSVEIGPSHCATCIAEVRQLGYQLIYKDGAGPGNENS
jgi:hypothetical protein